LKKLGIKEEKSFYEPCSNTQIIRRMILNLSNSWQKLGEIEKANEVAELLNHIPENNNP